MPGLTSGTVHVNQPLSNLARKYQPDPAEMVADLVCPILPVQHESDLYYTWTQGDFYGTDVTDLVPDRAEPRSVEFTASTSSYQAKRREIAWDISDRERENADDQLQLERTKQEGVLGRLALLREMRIEALLNINTTTTTIAGEAIVGGLDSSMTAAKTAFWDGSATTYASIFTDVVKGITKLRQSIGAKPNTIIIAAQVAEGLNKSQFYSAAAGPQFVYSTAPSNAANFTNYPLLPETLWGMRVLTPGQIKNTAVEGQAESYSDIWGEIVRILYVNPGPAMENPSCSYTFQSEALETRTMRDERKRLDWYATGRTIAEAAVAPFGGYTVTDCLT
jgi:hypothetical protein